MNMVWSFVGMLAAVVIVIVLLSVAESAIYAKIEEFKSRKNIKRAQQECVDMFKSSIDKYIDKVFEEEVNNDDKNRNEE